MEQVDLKENSSYLRWRQAKLALYPRAKESRIVTIKNPHALNNEEISALLDICDTCNSVIYQLLDRNYSDKSLVHALGQQLGLHRLDNNLRADEDSVTSLEVREQGGNQYIPYTNKPLSWHCDGYYNPLDQQIRGIIMHCVTPAEKGGENALIDIDMMYIRLRDENPDFITALMQPDVMTIPANIENGIEIRPAQTGPVFSVDPETNRLHMRYSARKRNIAWKEDELVRKAAAKITELLEDESLVLRHRLTAGQGIICNNVLHNRSGFEDGGSQKRLMYRARYYDRVAIVNSALGKA